MKANLDLAGIPMVVHTVSAAPADQCRAEALHVDAHCIKPFYLNALIAWVHDLQRLCLP